MLASYKLAYFKKPRWISYNRTWDCPSSTSFFSFFFWKEISRTENKVVPALLSELHSHASSILEQKAAWEWAGQATAWTYLQSLAFLSNYLSQLSFPVSHKWACKWQLKTSVTAERLCSIPGSSWKIKWFRRDSSCLCLHLHSFSFWPALKYII